MFIYGADVAAADAAVRYKAKSMIFGRHNIQNTGSSTVQSYRLHTEV